MTTGTVLGSAVSAAASIHRFLSFFWEVLVKTCSSCRRSLILAEFNLRTAAPDGRQSVCRGCNKARARRYYADNLIRHRKAVATQVAKTRAAHLERIGAYLLANPCVDCGEADLRVLDFDHRAEVEKTAEVMKLAKAAYSWKRVSEEIAKCDVRCRNCHAKITYERMGNDWRSRMQSQSTAGAGSGRARHAVASPPGDVCADGEGEHRAPEPERQHEVHQESVGG